MIFVLISSVLILTAYFAYRKTIKYLHFWKDREVEHLPPWPIVGNFLNLILGKENLIDAFVRLYSITPNARFFGIHFFQKPTLMIRDPELIKQICIKEFDSFPDHEGLLINPENNDIFSKVLNVLKGQEWKDMRSTLSPVFTSAKMKYMFNFMTECSKNFVQHFLENPKIANNEILELEMKDVFCKYTNDVIASTAFGLEVDSLKEPNNRFYIMGQTFTNPNLKQRIIMSCFQFFPFIARFFNMHFFPKKTIDYFFTIVKDNIAQREKENIVRPDLIHLLKEAKKQSDLEHHSNLKSTGGHIKTELTLEHMAAQALLFFFAGFDTASQLMSFAAHELALNPEAQEKLQQEIDRAFKEAENGQLSYDTVLKLPYLDQVVSESLRMWTPGFVTDRICAKNFKIESTNPSEKTLILEKGTAVAIPIIAIHRDPKYFKNPMKFDPERFSEENKSKIVPGSYIPFGIGPRNCIASRFALLEIKTLLVHLIHHFELVVVEKTDIPLKLIIKGINLAPKNGFNLGLRQRKK